MDFAFSTEQGDLRDLLRGFLRDVSPESEVRRLMGTGDGFDRDVWRRMAEQLGLPGLIVPEEYGGSGAGFVELGIVMEEMGAALVPTPYLGTAVLATTALLTAEDPAAAQDYLPAIAAGRCIATLAVVEDNGDWNPATSSCRASRDGIGWQVDGAKMFVLDGTSADLVLLTAVTPAGVSLFAVDGQAAGLSRIPLATLDQTRKQARLELRDVPARLIGQEGAAVSIVSSVFDLAAVALAAEQVGGAQRALDMAVDYAKTRVQFGRQIGSFQAVKHTCADLLIEVESARSAAYYALWSAAEQRADLPLVASLAKAYCCDASFHVAAGNIQIHGGIGFTWEHPAHLYFKRAKAAQSMFGTSSYHLDLMARRLPGSLLAVR
jgi:alkylation response protein AidB-like acyl-CoA dehydrogenase